MRNVRITAGLLLAVIAACVTKGPRQTKLMKSTEMTISVAALKVQVRSLASRFSGLMEEAAEEYSNTTRIPRGDAMPRCG